MAEATPSAEEGDTVPRPRWRRAGDPPRRLFLGCLGVTIAVTLYQAIQPNGDFDRGLALAAGWLGLAVVWLCMLASALVRPAARARLRRRYRQWLVVPLVVVAVAVALYAELPLRVGLAASEDALRDTAIAVSEGREPDLGRHGIYQVTRAERIPGGVLLSVAGGDGWFHIDGGLAYLPDGNPGAGGRTVYFDHIDGPWYRWYERW
jgi:hypothetical protein